MGNALPAPGHDQLQASIATSTEKSNAVSIWSWNSTLAVECTNRVHVEEDPSATSTYLLTFYWYACGGRTGIVVEVVVTRSLRYLPHPEKQPTTSIPEASTFWKAVVLSGLHLWPRARGCPLELAILSCKDILDNLYQYTRKDVAKQVIWPPGTLIVQRTPGGALRLWAAVIDAYTCATSPHLPQESRPRSGVTVDRPHDMHVMRSLTRVAAKTLCSFASIETCQCLVFRLLKSLAILTTTPLYCHDCRTDCAHYIRSDHFARSGWSRRVPASMTCSSVTLCKCPFQIGSLAAAT
ncbi:hypothetical protein GQ44DRAFT_723425 [Phaeosphaeriaceae sp. PMI808]|nr:hypothetical protein GQ44DRAFT_723425 [Phaeosphaeriaceae sp. PMI808]